MTGSDEGAERFAAVIVELERELDWARLGELYCHEGGAGFFPPAQIEAQREAGLQLGSGLLEALEGLQEPSPGRSLYVGAALAELIPALAELLIARREVVLVNLPVAETSEIDRALAAVEARLDLSLPRIHTGGLEAISGPFDHAWITSVLTDPDCFPALHDRLYGRRGADATGRGDAKRETGDARRLMEGMVALLEPPALLTTTDEERDFAVSACARRGWRLTAPRRAVLSTIVGDALRHCSVIRDPDSLLEGPSR
jgi:hypothetical protein